MWQDYKFLHTRNTSTKPRIGISACLCGEKVRYDGRAKPAPDILDYFTPHAELIPLCPEVAVGMGVPRPPIQLVNEGRRIEAIGVEDPDQNMTDSLEQYADHVTGQQQPAASLSGYIFKSRSPSCGLGSTPVFNDDMQVGFGDGIYAHRIKQLMPWLPVTEETELETDLAQGHFLFLTMLVHDYRLNHQSNNTPEFFHLHHSPILDCIVERRTLTLLSALCSGYNERNKVSVSREYLHTLMCSLKKANPRDFGLALR